MSNGKPLACLRCGASIPSGFECASCAAPRLRAAAAHDDNPPAEPQGSDTPKLLLSVILALAMVAVLVFGARSASASMARERVEAARKAAAQEARWAKADSERKAQLARSEPPPSQPVANPAPISDPAPTAYEVPPMPAPYVPLPKQPQGPVSVECVVCHGTGSVTEDCARCDGEGEVECQHCEGYNFTTHRGSDPACPNCGGSSRRESAVGRSLGGVAFLYTCPKCHGSREVAKKCFNCYGAGKITASSRVGG